MVSSNLGIETYPAQLEPQNQDAVIWRFLNMCKFRDLMMTAELYGPQTSDLSHCRRCEVILHLDGKRVNQALSGTMRPPSELAALPGIG